MSAQNGFHYIAIPAKLVEFIHDELELDSKGYNSTSNFNYLFATINEFPPAEVAIPADLKEKIDYVASYLVFHIIRGHCFNDGNKRTAFLSLSIFLALNKMSSKYNEEKSIEALTQITNLIREGASPLKAIETVFKEQPDSYEYRLIKVLYELGGANSAVRYNSPMDIVPLIRDLTTEKPTSFQSHGFLFRFIDNIYEHIKTRFEKR